MGWSITLHLEISRRKDKTWSKYYTERAGIWRECRVFTKWGFWSHRTMKMFTHLSNILDDLNDGQYIPLKGIPADCSSSTMRDYCYKITDLPLSGDDRDIGKISRDEANELIKEYGNDIRIDIDAEEYIINPENIYANWCTTQEMEECINKSFKDDNGEYTGDYIEWLGLLGTMKGYEMSGEYICRAVYWFSV